MGKRLGRMDDAGRREGEVSAFDAGHDVDAAARLLAIQAGGQLHLMLIQTPKLHETYANALNGLVRDRGAAGAALDAMREMATDLLASLPPGALRTLIEPASQAASHFDNLALSALGGGESSAAAEACARVTDTAPMDPASRREALERVTSKLTDVDVAALELLVHENERRGSAVAGSLLQAVLSTELTSMLADEDAPEAVGEPVSVQVVDSPADVVLTTTEASQTLGLDRKTLTKRIERGAMYAYRQGRSWAVPAWQFVPDGQDGWRVLPHMGEVLLALPDDLHPDQVWEFFSEVPVETAGLGGRQDQTTPPVVLDWLATGGPAGPVVNLARTLRMTV